MDAIITQLVAVLSGGLSEVLPKCVLPTRIDVEMVLSNIKTVVRFCGAVAEELHSAGKVELAKSVLREAVSYVVAEADKYNRDYYGYWRRYKTWFGQESPCCCCDYQSELSGVAASLGFDDVSRWAVSIQCPASPRGYRREPSRAHELEAERHTQNVELIEAFIFRKLNFLKR